MKNLKFVYFDIGGVLIQDFSGNNKWYEMKKDLGFTPETISVFDSLWNEHTKRVNLDYEIDSFTQVLREKTNANIPRNYSMLMDFINRFEPNPYLAELVVSFASFYKMGLLTNLYPRMFTKIYEHKLLPQFEWQVVIDSSVVGYQKPEDKIYHLAEEMAQVEPNEILFIDNREENLVPPRKRGWQTFLYDSTNPKKSAIDLTKKIEVKS